MKLRNKKTGEVYTACAIMFGESLDSLERKRWKTLDEFNEDWEDYEEPKDNNYWYIDSLGEIKFHSTILDEIAGTPNNAMIRKIIGNYFETKEEAEKAVEKLKAWKRLKDKGFKFESWFGGSKDISFWLDTEIDEDIAKDLDLLFGGEE